MPYQGNPELISNLIKKRQLLQQGDPAHKKIRPLLLIMSGGAGGGVLGAGAAMGLVEMNLVWAFDTVLGISTGAGIGAYILCGKENASLGASIYYEECCTLKFFNPFRVPMVNIDFIETLLRNGRKALDLTRLQESRPEFWVAANHSETGDLIFIDAKSAKPDTIAAVKDAIALPGRLYGKPVKVDEIPLLDNFSAPFPAKEICARFQPTDILVIANATADKWEQRSPVFHERLLFRDLPRKFREKLQERTKRFHEGREFLASLVGINIGVIFAPYDNWLFNWRGKRFFAAYQAAQDDLLRSLLHFR